MLKFYSLRKHVFNLLDIYTLNTVIVLDGVIRLDACPFLFIFCRTLFVRDGGCKEMLSFDNRYEASCSCLFGYVI